MASRTPANRGRWLFGLGLAGALGVVGGWLWFYSAKLPDPRPVEGASEGASTEVLPWEGPSTALKQTIVVPMLDTPIPEGKSAVWCATFQVAWNRLKEDVAKGPVLVEGAEQVADRLNLADFSEADLPPRTFYAAAGIAKDGILGHFSLIPTGFRRKLLWPTNLPIVARLGTRPVPSR
jgi:hypothetical protein